MTKKLLKLQNAGKRLAKNSPELKEAKIEKKKFQDTKEHKLEIGDQVRLKGLDTIGEIIGINDKSIMVAFGSMITTVEPDKLEWIKSNNGKQAGKARLSISENFSERKLNFKPEVDLRGKRAEEALTIVSKLVEDAVLVSVRQLRILHGKR